MTINQNVYREAVSYEERLKDLDLFTLEKVSHLGGGRVLI